MTGNTSYVASGYTGLAHELSMSRDFEDAFFDDETLLRIIRERGDTFNTGYTVEGIKVLFPVILGDATTLVADGVADASELTIPTGEQLANYTQAAYDIAHYRMPMWRTSSEMRLGKGSRTATRGDLEQASMLTMVGSFKNAVNGDLMSANICARTAVEGVRHVLSESNTVGGIAQATDTTWAAKVTTGAGTFDLTLVNDITHEAKRGRQQVDLLLASYSTTNNIYGKFISAIQPSEMLVNNNGKRAEYGVQDIVYMGAVVEKDDAGTAGEVLGLYTKSWYWVGDTAPRLDNESPWPGTDARVRVYNMYAAVGCNNPRLNFRLSGLT